MKEKIVKNALWLTGSELIGRLLRAVLVVYAARVLGAADWGVFSYAVSLAALFTVFSDIGLSSVLTRELIKHPSESNRYISTSIFLKLFLLLIVSAIIIFLAPYFTKTPLPQSLLILMALLIVFDSLRSLIFAVTRAAEKMHIEAVANIIVQAFILVVGLAVLAQSANIINLAGVYVIASGFGLLLAGWLTHSRLKNIFSGFSLRLAKDIMTIAWPFALLGILGGVMLNTDIIMLGWLRDAAEIGYYSVAQKIILILYILPTIIAAASFPALTRLANKNKEEFAYILEKSIKTVILVALPITIGGIIIAPDFINIIFGAEYNASVTAFRILLVSLLINYPTTIIGNALFAYNKQKDFISFAALGAGSNIVFNALLIPAFGIEGAAVSTVLTQIISNSFFWIKMKKTNHFSLKGQLNKIIAANLAAGFIIFALYQLNINVLLIIGLSIAVYPAILYLLKETALNYAVELITGKLKRFS